MGEKIGSEKEIQAVMHNIKEQRLLEKTLGTLSLEESYSIRLINLDHKTIKVRQRRLKHKVKKIKSHLSTEEIVDLKLKGIDEQLAKKDNVVSNGAVRIAAAAKRLKLGVLPGAYRRTSAFRRLSTDTGTVSDEVSVSEEGNGGSWAVNQREKKPHRPRPATAVGLGTGNFSTKADTKYGVRPKTAPGRKKTSKTTDIDDILNDERSKTDPGKGIRRGSAYSSSSFGDELRKAKASERRQELLEQQALHKETTKGRCEAFMTKADRWVRENPSISFQERSDSRADCTPRSPEERDLRLEPTSTINRRRDSTPMDSESAWKDLDKCRYLRIDDDKIDLTGINTLVKDQVQMTKLFRHEKQPPMSNTFRS